MRVARHHTMGRTREQRVRDHMLAVGDKVFKSAVLNFLAEKP